MKIEENPLAMKGGDFFPNHIIDPNKIKGVGKVISTSINETTGGKEHRSMEIQMERIGCDSMDNYNDSFDEAAEEK